MDKRRTSLLTGQGARLLPTAFVVLLCLNVLQMWYTLTQSSTRLIP